MRSLLAFLFVLLSSCATVAERESMRRGLEVDCEEFLVRVDQAKGRIGADGQTPAKKYQSARALTDEFALPAEWILVAVALNRCNDGGSENLDLCRDRLRTLQRRFETWRARFD